MNTTTTPATTWNIYLSGEIHSAWRNQIIESATASNLPLTFSSPVLDHEASDNCGAEILGPEGEPFWKDHKSAKLNAIRTRTLLERADIVVVRFGEQYRQWNAAFDAGYASALGKPLIVVHPAEFTHALKEVDATALAVAETVEQVMRILQYVTQQH